MNDPLISIVTVSYNAVATIEQTILSVINQTYPNIEYIIIDGGSTDGTVDIIKKYTDQIAYWVSEPDKGIYDAMNKGIAVATGEWINFMNSGDTFCTNFTLQSVFSGFVNEYDIIYGDSIRLNLKDNCKQQMIAISEICRLEEEPIYRHGASFVKATVQKNYLFDLSKLSKIGFALDYHCIYRMYIDGYKFHKVNVFILSYLMDGVSNNPFQSLLYNYRIVSYNNFNLRRWFLLYIKFLFLFFRKLKFFYYLFIIS